MFVNGQSLLQEVKYCGNTCYNPVTFIRYGDADNHKAIINLDGEIVEVYSVHLVTPKVRH